MKATIRKLLNNLNLGTHKEDLASYVEEIETAANRTGVAVADAAGANPTAAEFDALLASLRDAGLIASS